MGAIRVIGDLIEFDDQPLARINPNAKPSVRMQFVDLIDEYGEDDQQAAEAKDEKACRPGGISVYDELRKNVEDKAIAGLVDLKEVLQLIDNFEESQ
jgi:hypothetical protein